MTSLPPGTLLGSAHLVYFGVYLPFRAVRSALRKGKGAVPQRTRVFQATVIDLVARGLISFITARAAGLDVFPARLPGWDGVVWGALICAVMIAVAIPHWRGGVIRGERFSYFSMPTLPAERAWWSVLSLLAGITEELTWRGVQFLLLARLTGSPALSVAVCALTFGLGHLTQGWRWGLVVVGFALAFHGLTWYSGSLYVAMAVHVVVDLVGGFYTAHAANKWGYEPR